jgi:hypothetical protein
MAHALETFLNASQISHSIVDNSNHMINKKIGTQIFADERR